MFLMSVYRYFNALVIDVVSYYPRGKNHKKKKLRTKYNK